MAVKCNDCVAEFERKMRELSENEDLLFSKQPYNSSTSEVRKSWWCAVMNSRILTHRAGLRGESIGLSGYLALKAPSPAPAPLLRLKSLFTPTGNPLSFSFERRPTTTVRPPLFVFSIILAWIPLMYWGSRII